MVRSKQGPGDDIDVHICWVKFCKQVGDAARAVLKEKIISSDTCKQGGIINKTKHRATNKTLSHHKGSNHRKALHQASF